MESFLGWLLAGIVSLAAFAAAARPAIKPIREFISDFIEAIRGLKGNNANTELIKEMTERIRVAQVDHADLDRLRRWKAAFDSLPECQRKCREQIEQMADDRRIRPLTAKELMENNKS
jgi:hypothetical protein